MLIHINLLAWTPSQSGSKKLILPTQYYKSTASEYFITTDHPLVVTAFQKLLELAANTSVAPRRIDLMNLQADPLINLFFDILSQLIKKGLLGSIFENFQYRLKVFKPAFIL